MTKDPVCEANVDEVEAMAKGLTAEFHGQKECFCSEACKTLFEQDPAQYLLRFGMPEGAWEQTHRAIQM